MALAKRAEQSSPTIDLKSAGVVDAEIVPGDWESGRKLGIGGSDIAPILGLESFGRTSFDVWTSKVMPVERSEEDEADWLEENERALWGTLNEANIMAQWGRRIRRQILHLGKTLFQSKHHEWMVGSPDGFCEIVKVEDDPRGGDAKCVDGRYRDKWGEPGTDQIPEGYLLQAAWYMALTGIDRWDIPALFGGNQLLIYSVERDLDLEAALIDAVGEFWVKHVLTGIPPTPVGRSAPAYFKRRFPKAGEDLRPALPQERDLMLTYRGLLDAEAELKELKALVGNRIRFQVGEDKGIAAEDVRALWSNEAGRTDWQKIARSLTTEEEIERLAKEIKYDGGRKLDIREIKPKQLKGSK